jgi:hypothetical protein
MARPALDPAAPTVLDRLAETTNAPDAIGFEAICQSLYTQRYTGSLVLHFRNGTPQEVEFPRSIRVKLSRG